MFRYFGLQEFFSTWFNDLTDNTAFLDHLIHELAGEIERKPSFPPKEFAGLFSSWTRRRFYTTKLSGVN